MIADRMLSWAEESESAWVGIYVPLAAIPVGVVERLISMVRNRFGAPRLTALDLRGAAEIANGIEKYGSMYAYQMSLFLRAVGDSPRTNCRIEGIGVPQK